MPLLPDLHFLTAADDITCSAVAHLIYHEHNTACLTVELATSTLQSRLLNCCLLRCCLLNCCLLRCCLLNCCLLRCCLLLCRSCLLRCCLLRCRLCFRRCFLCRHSSHPLSPTVVSPPTRLVGIRTPQACCVRNLISLDAYP
jgi:hypothetical protein